VLVSHFELVMLVVVVMWNRLKKCFGDTRIYNVEMEYSEVNDTTLGCGRKK